MCCFTGYVQSVEDTSIFVRDLGNGRHALAYAMTLETRDEVAMILPVPVLPGSGEDALKFINLQNYSSFFRDLDRMFPEKVHSRMMKSAVYGAAIACSTLVVHDVGNFIASFVPTVNDFGRLDARFQFDKSIWEKLPDYSTFGFAVFQLKPGNQKVHPMAYTYPAADPDALFFPTTHVHNKVVEKNAHYDHVLYYQHTGDFADAGWEKSDLVPADYIKMEKVEGLVHASHSIERLKVRGYHPNHDHILRRNPDGGLLNVIYVDARV